ncbi:MAG: hypothetical protein ACLQVG_16915 [Terriglobia bacterium]
MSKGGSFLASAEVQEEQWAADKQSFIGKVAGNNGTLTHIPGTEFYCHPKDVSWISSHEQDGRYVMVLRYKKDPGEQYSKDYSLWFKTEAERALAMTAVLGPARPPAPGRKGQTPPQP